MLLKSTSPMVSKFFLSYLIILWIHPCKYELKALKRVHCKCLFLAGNLLQLFQCFNFFESTLGLHTFGKKSEQVISFAKKFAKDKSRLSLLDALQVSFEEPTRNVLNPRLLTNQRNSHNNIICGGIMKFLHCLSLSNYEILSYRFSFNWTAVVCNVSNHLSSHFCVK